jgi:hypothetical protein
MNAAHERPPQEPEDAPAPSKRRRVASGQDDRPSLGAQLIHAARHGEIETVNSLVARGASLRATQAGKSALDYAARSNNLPMVECLLAHGADPTFDGEIRQALFPFPSRLLIRK